MANVGPEMADPRGMSTFNKHEGPGRWSLQHSSYRHKLLHFMSITNHKGVPFKDIACINNHIIAVIRMKRCCVIGCLWCSIDRTALHLNGPLGLSQCHSVLRWVAAPPPLNTPTLCPEALLTHCLHCKWFIWLQGGGEHRSRYTWVSELWSCWAKCAWSQRL